MSGNDPGWVSRQEMARFLGLSTRYLDEQRNRFANAAERRDGRHVLLHAPTWADLHFRQKYASDPADAEAGDLGAGSSPQLERYRRLKADEQEMRNSQRRGELVKIVDVTRVLDRVAERYRVAAEGMCACCCEKAIEAMADAEATFDAEYPGAGTQPAPQASEKGVRDGS